MADINTSVFTSIIFYFQTLWASFLGIFSRTDRAPVDIEAGIAPTPGPKSRTVSQLEKGLPVNNLVAAIDNISHSVPSGDDGYVEVELHAVPKEPIVRSSNVVERDLPLSNRTSVNYDHPSRRPSRRESAVDPMKARVLDDTFRHVQDQTLDVVKQVVVITPGTVFPTACSAQIEFYDGPIAQACEAKVEYWTGAPVVESYSAEVEYCDAPTFGSPGMEVETSFSSVESSYTQVGTCPVVPGTKVEDDAGAEYDEDADADRELDEIELCIKELEATLNSFKAPLRTRPISPIPPAIKSETDQAPRLKRKHRVQFAMYHEEVPYPTQAERTTGAQQQQRDRKSKKREDDLSDVISQFPDIPAFVPTCPPGRVSPGTQIPASVSSKYAYHASPDSRRHSVSSSSSDASRSSYGTRSGSDTEQTSTAPSSPDSAGPESLDARRPSSPVWFADRKLTMPGSEASRTAPLRVAKRSRN